MRNLFVIMVFLFLPLVSVVAQESPVPKSSNHEIGLDAAPLVRWFRLGTNSSHISDPYFLQYRYHFEPWAVRVGVGGLFQTNSSSTNDTSSTKDDRVYIEARLGLERKVYLFEKFNAYYGVDGLATITRTSIVTQETLADTITLDAKENAYGGSAFVGFRYQFNHRMALTAEYSFRVLYALGRYERNYSLGPVSTRIHRQNSLSANLHPYIVLMFNYRL